MKLSQGKLDEIFKDYNADAVKNIDRNQLSASLQNYQHGVGDMVIVFVYKNVGYVSEPFNPAKKSMIDVGKRSLPGLNQLAENLNGLTD